MLSIKEITEFTEFLKIKDIWDTLLAKSGIINPYLTHDWFRITYEYFEKEAELFILLVNEQDNVIAIAPFLISNEKYYGVYTRKIRFLENVHTPFQDFILTQKKQFALKAILDFLYTNFHLWDIMELMEIRNTSENIRILDSLFSDKNNFHYRFLISRSWSVPTNMSLDEGLNKLKPKVRREFKRKIRRIEKLGKLSFHVITESGEIEKNLDKFFNFYEQSWKGKERNADFYYRIAREFSRRKEFIMYCLCLNENPIAYTCTLKSKSTLFCLKTTFDPSYCAFSSGSIMFHKIFENSFNDTNIDIFDIGRGDEKYKLDFESIPVNQMIFIGGHKKTFASYLIHVRFKLALYIKKKRVLLAILTFLKDSNILIKKISEYFNNKDKFFRKDRQVNIYFMKLSPVKTDYSDNDWLCRKADADDIERLAVTMKVKRFSDLKEKLANEQCFLIIEGAEIHHYFWFSQNNLECGIPNITDDQIILTEIDPLFFKIDNDRPVKIFNILAKELKDQKYNMLFAFSKSVDNQGYKLFKSLGFQRYKELKKI
jgi:hypothetical protein